jgi:glycosyltransferase involved in cell wall biosynthesis
VRILVVTNMFPTLEHPDFGAVVREQARSLVARGVEVEVLEIAGRASKTNYLTAAPAVRRRVRENGFSLIHAHYGLSGAVALAQRRLPVVTTFHGSDTGYVRWQGVVSRYVARLTTPVFVSRDGARRLGVERPVVIPCGVDMDLFRPLERSAARRKLGWPVDPPYALLPGARTNPVKGGRLFEAAVREAQKELPELRTASLEHYGREEVSLVLNAVDVTVMTSESEGSPVTIKESRACETPVVSVPVGDVPGLIAGLPGCRTVDRTPESLADALLEAVSAGPNPELRRRVEPFSLERVADRLVALYEDVARRSAAGAG